MDIRIVFLDGFAIGSGGTAYKLTYNSEWVVCPTYTHLAPALHLHIGYLPYIVIFIDTNYIFGCSFIWYLVC